MLVIFIGQEDQSKSRLINQNFNTSHYYPSTLETKTDDPNLKRYVHLSKYIQPIFVEAPEAIFFLFEHFRDRLAVL